MPSSFDADFAAADALMAEVFGVPVGIRRMGNDPTTVTAEVTVTDYEVPNEQTGLTEIIQFRDYLIPVADYQVGGIVVEPRDGDRLLESIGGADCEFVVVPVGKRPAAEWHDLARNRWLIHTKQFA